VVAGTNVEVIEIAGMGRMYFAVILIFVVYLTTVSQLAQNNKLDLKLLYYPLLLLRVSLFSLENKQIPFPQQYKPTEDFEY
jgi:hypothetical protein